MKNKLFALTLVSTFGISSIFNIPTVEAQTRNVYRCVMKNGAPTTIVDTKRGRIDLIVWKSNLFSGWSPLKRCQSITTRFQGFSDQGALRYITTGNINNQPAICVAQNIPGRGISCRRNGLLITLQPNDNPQKVMNDLFNLSARVRGGAPITRSAEGQSILAIDQFLDEVEVSEENPQNNPVENPAPVTPQSSTSTKPQPISQGVSSPQPLQVIEEPTSSQLPTVTELGEVEQSSPPSMPSAPVTAVSSPVSMVGGRYSCITYNGMPTTAVTTSRGLVQVIAWQSSFFQSTGWTPQKRCEEVSKRFNQFDQQGSLSIVTHGVMNNSPVICVGERKPGQTDCKADGLLLTLEPKDNPQEVMQQMFAYQNTSAQQVAVVRSGGNYVINLNQFINNAPVIKP